MEANNGIAFTILPSFVILMKGWGSYGPYSSWWKFPQLTLQSCLPFLAENFLSHKLDRGLKIRNLFHSLFNYFFFFRLFTKKKNGNKKLILEIHF